MEPVCKCITLTHTDNAKPQQWFQRTFNLNSRLVPKYLL